MTVFEPLPDACPQHGLGGRAVEDGERDVKAHSRASQQIALPALEERRIDDRQIAGRDNLAGEGGQSSVRLTVDLGGLNALRLP